MKHSAAGLAGLMFALVFSISPALAEMEVLSSNVPEIAPGITLKDYTPLHLPAGAVVRVLIKPAGTTKTLKGPYKGTVASYKARRGWVRRVIGRARDPEPPVGAARSSRP